jgi:hypothetical protein
MPATPMNEPAFELTPVKSPNRLQPGFLPSQNLWQVRA